MSCYKQLAVRVGRIRVLHVLANSHPDTNGYAIRSHMIVKHQNQIEDMEVHAITSPFYPNRQLMQEDIEHDGINYVRCKHPILSLKNTV